MTLSATNMINQMKTVKNVCGLIGVAGVLLAPNLYAGLDYGSTGTISFTYPDGPLEFADGGAFAVTTTPNVGGPNLGTFQTFCIEFNENISYPPGTYDYTINSGAVQGGSGALATDPYTGLHMDNVSIGTAWLYSQFRAGAFGTLTAPQAGQLQNAIWYLEGEITLSQLSTQNGVDGTGFFDAALNHFGISASSPGTPNLSGIFADSHGAFGVVALNLFNGAYAQQVTAPSGVIYNLNQDQLAIVPVPEPTTLIAGASLLLPFGAGTLRILRKRRAA
jgi:hypothetical protein